MRKDMMRFLRMVARDKLLQEVHITTNGTLTGHLVPELKELGIKSVNLSLDTLDKTRFAEITRRDQFNQVMYTFEQLLKYKIPCKINMVVMEGRNTQDLNSMALLARDHPVNVRFIEEMPFNGSGSTSGEGAWNHIRILEELSKHFSNLSPLPFISGATATNYSIPGFKGTLGIIAAYSRTFCGTCNRLRVTPKGQLKTCLYDHGIFNIKDMMRSGASDAQISTALQQAIGHRAKDGFEAERSRVHFPISESMSTIGG